jgi:Taurine catabolism dioxygenase TauD, TfdA family
MSGSCAIIATVVIKSDVIAVSVRGARSRRFEFPWRIKIEPQPTRQGSNLSVLRRLRSARGFGWVRDGRVFFHRGHVARLSPSIPLRWSCWRSRTAQAGQPRDVHGAVGPSRVVAIRASKGRKSDDVSLRPFGWRRTRSVSLVEAEKRGGSAQIPIVRRRLGERSNRPEGRLIWRNPANARDALYIASHAGAIEGVDDARGRALLARLIDQATQSAHVYSHRWRAGDVILGQSRHYASRASLAGDTGEADGAHHHFGARYRWTPSGSTELITIRSPSRSSQTAIS